LPRVAAHDHVVDGPWFMDARFSCHTERVASGLISSRGRGVRH
jgi:hypothetical protein